MVTLFTTFPLCSLCHPRAPVVIRPLQCMLFVHALPCHREAEDRLSLPWSPPPSLLQRKKERTFGSNSLAAIRSSPRQAVWLCCRCALAHCTLLFLHDNFLLFLRFHVLSLSRDFALQHKTPVLTWSSQCNSNI